MQAGWNKHSAAPTSDIPAALTEGGGRGSRGAKARESGDEGCQEEGQGQMQHCSWPLAPWNTIWKERLFFGLPRSE